MFILQSKYSKGNVLATVMNVDNSAQDIVLFMTTEN